jgi:hypothetical protein
MIGIELKDLDQEIETRRFKLKTKLMKDANSLHYILLTLALHLVFTKSATDLIGYLLIGLFTGSL